MKPHVTLLENCPQHKAGGRENKLNRSRSRGSKQVLGKAQVHGLIRPGRSGLAADAPSRTADVQNWVGWGSLCRGALKWGHLWPPACHHPVPLTGCVSHLSVDQPQGHL